MGSWANTNFLSMFMCFHTKGAQQTLPADPDENQQLTAVTDAAIATYTDVSYRFRRSCELQLQL